MTDSPPDDDEAERRFNETLGRMVNTPPNPHRPLKDREPQPASPKPTKTFEQKLAENPDSFDDFDFGEAPKEGDAYMDSLREGVGSRLIFIEHDGALFRGPARGLPKEVWSPRQNAWKAYTFEGDYKPVEWGTKISAAEAEEMMAETSQR